MIAQYAQLQDNNFNKLLNDEQNMAKQVTKVNLEKAIVATPKTMRRQFTNNAKSDNMKSPQLTGMSSNDIYDRTIADKKDDPPRFRSETSLRKIENDNSRSATSINDVEELDERKPIQSGNLDQLGELVNSEVQTIQEQLRITFQRKLNTQQ